MYKFAIVGCGRIAKRHSELLGNQIIGDASLVAVCDLNKDKCKKIGDQYNLPYYTDMHEMMRNEDIDVVVVLTESGNHAKNVIELAAYKKHIVVEKPMAITLSDAREMINFCASENIKLFVMKQNRFNVPVLKLREALEAGRFGSLVLGTIRVRWCRPQAYYDQDEWRGTWRYDGGVLTNQASHHVDLLEWMMGEVESVSAKSVTALVDIEAEDTAVAIIKFKNGALGVIEATTAIRPSDLEGSISILGSSGSVEIAGFAVNEMKHWNFSEAQDGDDEVLTRYSVNPPNVYGFGHQAYYEHIIRCLDGKEDILVGGEEGLGSLKLITAIYESIETSSEIFLDDFEPTHCKLGV